MQIDRRITNLETLTMSKYFGGIVPYIILAVISVIVFCNTLDNTFVYDDSVTIVNNNLIKSWKNFHTIFSFNYFILSGELSYRPLVTLSYFIDYSLWEANPGGFHLTNLLLQTANTILFYVFLKRVTKVNTLAFFSTLLFTTHPILTETVNSISYREDLLTALFFLIAFILYLKINKTFFNKSKFLLYYLGSLFSYLLALFSKEMAITFPILLILFDIFYLPSGKPLQALIKKLKGIYIGYFSVTGFYLFIQFVVFRHVYIRLDQTKQSLFVMIKVLASYIKLLFLPFNLNADYVIPPITTGIISFIISILIVTIVIIITIRLCKNNKQHWFFISWFFITLLPVSNIIPIGNIMAERYLYIPIMGISGIIGILIQKSNLKNPLATICSSIVIFILGVMCINRNGIWRDEFTLWYSTSIREPNSARAHHNLGVVHSSKDFYDYAEYEYKKTLEINPKDTEAHYNLGNAYERKGILDNAIKEYQDAIRYNPYYADAYNNLGNLYKEAVTEFARSLKINSEMSTTHNHLGNTYKEMGNIKDALTEYTTAIELDPSAADYHNNLGIVYTNIGQLKEAIDEFETAIRLDQKLANTHNNLGIAHAKKGDLDKAIDELNKAVALGFDNADVHNNLAGVYLTKGLTDNAIVELKLALKFNPKDSNAHCNLGNAYISKNLGDEAISEFKEAITCNPADGEIYYYLGNAFYRKGRYSEAVDAFNQSVRYQPKNPLAHKMLGVIYANCLNNHSKALFHLNETLRFDPQQPMAKEIMGMIDKLKKTELK